MQRDEIGPLFTTHTNINSKKLTDLYVRPEIIKLLGENIVKNPHDIGPGIDFLDVRQKAQATKAKIRRWDYIKVKSFCTTKLTINEVKKLFAKHVSDEDLISKT